MLPTFLDQISLFLVFRGAPEADLAVPSASFAQGEFFLTVNGVPLHTALHINFSSS